MTFHSRLKIKTTTVDAKDFHTVKDVLAMLESKNLSVVDQFNHDRFYLIEGLTRNSVISRKGGVAKYGMNPVDGLFTMAIFTVDGYNARDVLEWGKDSAYIQGMLWLDFIKVLYDVWPVELPSKESVATDIDLSWSNDYAVYNAWRFVGVSTVESCMRRRTYTTQVAKSVGKVAHAMLEQLNRDDYHELFKSVYGS